MILIDDMGWKDFSYFGNKMAKTPDIDASARGGKPFFVNLWPDDVHSPFWPPVDQWREGKRGLYHSVL